MTSANGIWFSIMTLRFNARNRSFEPIIAPIKTYTADETRSNIGIFRFRQISIPTSAATAIPRVQKSPYSGSSFPNIFIIFLDIIKAHLVNYILKKELQPDKSCRAAAVNQRLAAAQTAQIMQRSQVRNMIAVSTTAMIPSTRPAVAIPAG